VVSSTGETTSAVIQTTVSATTTQIRQGLFICIFHGLQIKCIVFYYKCSVKVALYYIQILSKEMKQPVEN
jgi:hypothetical protein